MGNYKIITIELKDGRTGYDVIGEYIRRYWQHNIYETVITCIAVSHNGRDYDVCNEVAYPDDGWDIVFLNDWWEGEKFIKILGIQAVSELKIYGGLYEE